MQLHQKQEMRKLNDKDYLAMQMQNQANIAK